MLKVHVRQPAAASDWEIPAVLTFTDSGAETAPSGIDEIPEHANAVKA